VRPGETGLLVPPGDAGALAEALAATLDLDPGTRLALARHQIAHAREHFSSALMTRRTLDVYEELVPRQATAPVAA